jgi:hypothetical protein
MAGVLETRGKIRRVDNPLRKTIQLILQLQNRNVHIPERMAALTGVKIRVTEAREITVGERRGCVEHCPEAHVHLGAHLPRMAVWAITGVGASVVLHNLAPYMHPATDLSVVDDYIDGLTLPADWAKPGPGMYAIWETVNRLRTIGWEIPEPLTVVPRKWLSGGGV